MSDRPNCFGFVMSSKEYLEKHGIVYAKKCEECEHQRECIAEYNERIYNTWLDSVDEDEEIEYCDYTGEECIGNKLFCEECPMMEEEEPH